MMNMKYSDASNAFKPVKFCHYEQKNNNNIVCT